MSKTFELSTSEFKGFVQAKLESIESSQTELKLTLKEFNQKNSEQHNDLYSRIRKIEKPTRSIDPLGWLRWLF